MEQLRPDALLSLMRTIGSRLIGVTGVTVATSVIGFVLQIALAGRFGAGLEVDGYLFAMSVPTALAGLVVAAMSYALVPCLVRAEDARGLSGLLELVALGVLILMVLCGAAAMVLQPMLLPDNSDILKAPRLGLLILLGWCVGGAQVLLGLKVIQFNANRRAFTAALINLPPNIFALLALTLLGGVGILTVPIGLAVGTGVMAILAAFFIGGPARTWPRKSDVAQLATFVPALISATFAVSCFTAYVVVDAYWAPRAGPGVLATLGFSQRLLIGIGSLIVAGPSAVLTPYFAARVARGDWRGFRRLSFGVAAVAGVSAAIGAILLGLTAPLLVEAAFGRGAFDAGDVQRVTGTFIAMLPGFSAMIVAVIATRALYCLPTATWPAAVLGVSWVGVYFVSSSLLHKHGAPGLGLAFSVSWLWLAAADLVALAWLSRRASEKINR
jgi:putative peptidoglycan lipid II flippase